MGKKVILLGKKTKLFILAISLGWCLALVGYTTSATLLDSQIPGSAADPLVTQSYVDQSFKDLENRLKQLETRIQKLPKPKPPVEPSGPQPVQIAVNGRLVVFPEQDQKPYIDPTTSRTLVPIRFVMETIEAEVDWYAPEKKVTIAKADTKIELWINKATVRVNGVQTTTDQPPVLVQDRTMVPLRFFSEKLGYTVEWDPASYCASILTD